MKLDYHIVLRVALESLDPLIRFGVLALYLTPLAILNEGFID